MNFNSVTDWGVLIGIIMSIGGVIIAAIKMGFTPFINQLRAFGEQLGGLSTTLQNIQNEARKTEERLNEQHVRIVRLETINEYKEHKEDL